MTPEWDYFWPLEHNLNQLKSVLLENATYQSSRPGVFTQEYFLIYLPI